MKAYYYRMQSAFGFRFIFLLFITQCFLKGIMFVVFTTGVFPLMKAMGVDAVRVQVYGALALSPWTIKPLIGVLSDLVAIGGYHKRYWMLMSVLIGIVGCTMMVSLIPNVLAIVAFLCMAHYEIAITDLLMEGRYAEMMREHPETGSDIVTLSNGFQQAGFVIGMSFLGPLSDMGEFRIINIIALALSCTPIVPLLFGFLNETKRVGAPLVLLDTLRVRKEWRIVMVVALTGMSAPAMAAIAAFASKWIGLTCSVVVIIGAAISGFFAFDNKIIAKVALYQILAQASKISFSSALDFFFTADDVCLPGGPAFSYKFYITATGLVQVRNPRSGDLTGSREFDRALGNFDRPFGAVKFLHRSNSSVPVKSLLVTNLDKRFVRFAHSRLSQAVAGLLTVFIYQWLFSRWRFRSVLLFGTVLSGVAGVFDFIIVKRWNLYIGIPDWIFFLIGDDVLHTVVEMIYWIPSSSIIGKVCPPNMESCTYAYLAGVSNFGKMISVIFGAWLIELFGIQTLGPQCQWANLEWLILGGHIVVMLLISIPATWLIPNVPQDADLITHHSSPIPTEEKPVELMGDNDDITDFSFE